MQLILILISLWQARPEEETGHVGSSYMDVQYAHGNNNSSRASDRPRFQCRVGQWVASVTVSPGSPTPMRQH